MEDGPPRFPQGSSCPVVLGFAPQRVQPVSLTGLSPSLVSLSRTPQLPAGFLTPRRRCNTVRMRPATPSAQRSQALTCTGFGLFPLRSPLLGESLLLSLPPGTKMVHFPGFASRTLLDSGADAPTLLGALLQDSDTPGSQPVCGSPRLFAAYHVLPRLPSPRHPPYALSSLTIKFAPLETQTEPTSWPLFFFTRRYLIVKDPSGYTGGPGLPSKPWTSGTDGKASGGSFPPDSLGDLLFYERSSDRRRSRGPVSLRGAWAEPGSLAIYSGHELLE